MSIARRTEKNAKVRKDLNIPPCGARAIKVLTDLETRRDALFYRHLGPKGPEETCRCIQNLAPCPNRSYPVNPDNPGHPASDARDIKGLTDLEKLRAAFFYRHLGPSGPKEDPLLQPEPLRRAQTALILHILIILAILLQTIAIKVLSDLSLVFLLRVYRHSGPLGPGGAFWVASGCYAARGDNPVHSDNLGHPASDKKARGGQTPARQTDASRKGPAILYVYRTAPARTRN